MASGCSSAETAPLPAPQPSSQPAVLLTPAPNVPGQPANGARLIVERGCGGCHTVSGVEGATGVAGPNLTNVVVRPTLAGDSIPMSPENMTRWLLDPPAMKPGTPMPNLGLSEQDAQDLTAFLYSQPYNPEQ